jgi:Fe2+ or Zn2+ uptake regulation protein
MTDNKTINPDDSRWTDTLQTHGLRPTYARRLVLALMAEHNDHPTTDGIIQALREKGYPVSVATLYQNLNKLVESGLLHRLTDANGLNRFDANLNPHHHLICTSCSAMMDVTVNEKPLLKKKPTDYQSGDILSGWNIDSAHVELKGICPSCKVKG